MIKHLAHVECNWVDMILRRPRRTLAESDYEDAFRLKPDETLAQVLEHYEQVAVETERVIAGIDDLGQPVPVPDAPWFPKDVEAWSVRWVLLHLIEETARHAGHADVVREAVDGATAMPLLAAAEGWPESPWVTPWSPGQGA